MYGKPSVSCDIGTGSSFINRHGETGLVVEPEQPQQLAAAVNRLMTNRQEREAFGRNARKRYLEHFTADAMIAGYAKEYRGIFEEHKPWKP
jgi:rhamnosyl/mannosyltransferase